MLNCLTLKLGFRLTFRTENAITRLLLIHFENSRKTFYIVSRCASAGGGPEFSRHYSLRNQGNMKRAQSRALIHLFSTYNTFYLFSTYNTFYLFSTYNTFVARLTISIRARAALSSIRLEDRVRIR